jgi:uncharacterized Tic20 family protein
MNSLNDNAQLTALLSMFAAQLPILIVCLLGCVVVMARKNELGGASFWALLGFGLSIVLCILIPLVQTVVQKWTIESGGSMAQRASLFTVLAIAWSILRAVTYALLLMAVLAGRAATRPTEL